MSNTWRDEQHPSFINFISTFLSANSFRLNFVAIAPVISLTLYYTLISCNGGIIIKLHEIITVGFYFQLWWFIGGIHLCDELGLHKCLPSLWQVSKMLPLLVFFPGILFIWISFMQNSETEDAVWTPLCCHHTQYQEAKWFFCSFLLQVSFKSLLYHLVIFIANMMNYLVYLNLLWRFQMELGKPTFIPVRDPEMGFEKIVKIAHSLGGKTFFEANSTVLFQVIFLNCNINCSMQATRCQDKIEVWGRFLWDIFSCF